MYDDTTHRIVDYDKAALNSAPSFAGLPGGYHHPGSPHQKAQRTVHLTST